MNLIYVLLFLGGFSDAVDLAKKGNHEASEDIFQTMKADSVDYYFWRMVNNYNLNNGKEAVKWANKLNDTFEDVPLRYQHIAELIINDVGSWKKDKEDLIDIAREMTRSKNRLSNSAGGEKTQKIQKDIVDRLDQIIKKKEQEAEDAAKAAQQQQQQSQQSQQQLGQTPGDPFGPMKDSNLNQGNAGPGVVEQKKFKETVGNWGSMPEKERAKAALERSRDIPAKHRQLVEDYLRKLAQQEGK